MRDNSCASSFGPFPRDCERKSQQCHVAYLTMPKGLAHRYLLSWTKRRVTRRSSTVLRDCPLQESCATHYYRILLSKSQQFHWLAGRRRSFSRDTKYIRTLTKTAPLTERANTSEATATGAGGHGATSQTTKVFRSRTF